MFDESTITWDPPTTSQASDIKWDDSSIKWDKESNKIVEGAKDLGTFALKGVAGIVPGAVLGANYWASRIAGDTHEEAMKYAENTAATVQSMKPTTVPEIIAEEAPKMLGRLPAFGAVGEAYSAAGLVNPWLQSAATFGTVSGGEALMEGKSAKDIAKETAISAATGPIWHAAGLVGKFGRTPLESRILSGASTALTGAGMAAAGGGSTQDIVGQGILGLGMGVMSPGRPSIEQMVAREKTGQFPFMYEGVESQGETKTWKLVSKGYDLPTKTQLNMMVSVIQRNPNLQSTLETPSFWSANGEQVRKLSNATDAGLVTPEFSSKALEQLASVHQRDLAMANAVEKASVAKVQAGVPLSTIEALVCPLEEGKVVRERLIGAYRDEKGKLRDIQSKVDLESIGNDMLDRITKGENLPKVEIKWAFNRVKGKPNQNKEPMGWHWRNNAITFFNADGEVVGVDNISPGITLREQYRAKGKSDSWINSHLGSGADIRVTYGEHVISLNRYSELREVPLNTNMLKTKAEFLVALRTKLTAEQRVVLDEVVKSIDSSYIVTGENMKNAIIDRLTADSDISRKAVSVNRGRVYRGTISDMYEVITHEIGHAYGTTDTNRAQTEMAIKLRKYKFNKVTVEYLAKKAATDFVVNLTYPDGKVELLKTINGKDLIELVKNQGCMIDGLWNYREGKRLVRSLADMDPSEITPDKLVRVPYIQESINPSGQQELHFGNEDMPINKEKPGLRAQTAIIENKATGKPGYDMDTAGGEAPPVEPPPPGGEPYQPDVPRVPKRRNIPATEGKDMTIEHMRIIDGELDIWSGQSRDLFGPDGLFKKMLGVQVNLSPRMKKALGVYQDGMIRLRNMFNRIADPMRTFAHEVGHFLDDAMGRNQALPIPRQWENDIRQELVKVSTKQRGPMHQGDEYRNSRSELWADYFSLRSMDEAEARRLAPRFTEFVNRVMQQDQEFSYLITKMKQVANEMLPILEKVKIAEEQAAKLPDYKAAVEDFKEQGNWLQNLWREKVADKLHKAIVDKWRKLAQSETKTGAIVRFLDEQRGHIDPIFELLRQRIKLMSGQSYRVQTDIINPLSKLSAQDQRVVADALLTMKGLPKDHPLHDLTERTRVELLMWANEARKLGLMHEESFWNNAGQYFPFLYTSKEFKANADTYGTIKLNAVRANLSMFKGRMTDIEFGKKGLAMLQAEIPSDYADIMTELGQRGITKLTDVEYRELGKKFRADMGLIKTAAYPVYKRLNQLIKTVYTVKMYNIMADTPGIIGKRSTPGYEKMFEGRTYGRLSGEYVPRTLKMEVKGWENAPNILMRGLSFVQSGWKTLKVPYNLPSYARNITTNLLTAYAAGDVPVWNGVMLAKHAGEFVQSQIALGKGKAPSADWANARDNGLFRHTYSSEELTLMATIQEQMGKDPEGGMQYLAKMASVIEIPSKAYGFIEDMSKFIIYKYAVDKGASPLQAVKFADKLLFDYSQTSEAVKFGKVTTTPFITWSAKMLPLLGEIAIRKPEKIALIAGSMFAISAMVRAQLGISQAEEEKRKPDYLRGKNTILMGKNPKTGELEWMDLTYFMPWGGWISPAGDSPVGKMLPQPLAPGGVPIMLMNVLFNYDPFSGQIAKDSMTESEKNKAIGDYIANYSLPSALGQSREKIVHAIQGRPMKPGGQAPERGKVALSSMIGVNITSSSRVSAAKGKAWFVEQQKMGITAVRKQVAMGDITVAEGNKKIAEHVKEIKKYLAEH